MGLFNWKKVGNISYHRSRPLKLVSSPYSMPIARDRLSSRSMSRTYQNFRHNFSKSRRGEEVSLSLCFYMQLQEINGLLVTRPFVIVCLFKISTYVRNLVWHLFWRQTQVHGRFVYLYICHICFPYWLILFEVLLLCGKTSVNLLCISGPRGRHRSQFT